MSYSYLTPTFPAPNPPLPTPAAWGTLLIGGFSGLYMANVVQEYQNKIAKIKAGQAPSFFPSEKQNLPFSQLLRRDQFYKNS